MQNCERELQDAHDDAERYRDEAEHLRRREIERDNERERQRKEERRQRDPSNRLYNGDVSNFHDAVVCHIVCLNREIVPVDPKDDADLQALTKKCNDSMREGIIAANRAREIYDRIYSELNPKVIAELRAAGLDDWANCLESGDYSSMAV